MNANERKFYMGGSLGVSGYIGFYGVHKIKSDFVITAVL